MRMMTYYEWVNFFDVGKLKIKRSFKRFEMCKKKKNKKEGFRNRKVTALNKEEE